MESFDVCIIGAGPGGYVAAIRAAQLGLKTACIEKYPRLGGTCLNVGCIPSKSLLHASELYETAKHASDWGVEVKGLGLDLSKMLAKKDDVVEGLTSGIAGLFKKNKITSIQGVGSLAGEGKVNIKGDDGDQTIEAKHIIIATGSKPVELPFMKFDDQTVVHSTGALSFPEVPKHLVVVGGGVIGLELGSVWSRLGANVTVVEFMDRILPTMDGQISKEMKRVLGKKGMKFHLKTKVTACEVSNGVAKLTAEDSKGKTIELEADKVLVCVGRKPNTQGLNAEAVGLKLDDRGRIHTDHHFQTNLPGVYAIGDVIKGPMLAHKAEDEGIACVERIVGIAGHVNYDAIPGIVYTHPEVAAVGKTEEELKEAGVPFKAGKFSFRANSRARCIDQVDGFVKILAHKDTDEVLGVHMVGPAVSELIQEGVLAIEFQASSEDLARTVHGHPGFCEAIKEAAFDVEGRTIHF